jgi:REP element-mobilizing transposase RayT
MPVFGMLEFQHMAPDLDPESDPRPRHPSAHAQGRERQSNGDRKGAHAPAAQKSIPLAYLITFNCYGARLHGDEAGSVNPEHNIPESEFIPPNRGWFLSEVKEMTQAPYELAARQRRVVSQAIRDVCTHREWILLAIHVRSNHIHSVVSARASPEKVMNDFKAYASRALNREGKCLRRWARHGSTRYLWDANTVAAATEYVVHGQGRPMAVWENPIKPAW